MTLINNYGKYFTNDDENEIYRNFRERFDEYWGSLEGGFQSPESSDYISFLKSFEIETKYKYQRLGTMNKKEFLEVMEKLASGYEGRKLYQKHYDCSTVLEIRKVSNVDTLLSFLENNQPCAACAHCLGSIGVEFQHEQLHASAWMSKLPQYPEDALDYDYAGMLCMDAHSDNGCMRRKRL